jgi:hypothetical protein
MSNRNSFSKWCLQYSPIPVVVVRPTEKREKKKKKRDADPARQDYARILRESGLVDHEVEHSDKGSIFEPPNDANEEAHAVAAALGLPAAFDPTLKPINLEGGRALRKVESGRSDASSVSPDCRPTSPNAVIKSPKSPQFDSPALSEGESSEGEDDDEGEFEVVAGHALLGNEDERPEIERKKKLHEMEVGEAAALARGRKASVGSTGSASSGGTTTVIDEDDDEE